MLDKAASSGCGRIQNQASIFHSDPPMNHLFLLFLIAASSRDAQAQSSQYTDPSMAVPNSFRPSIAVVIGILSIMFSLTFLLLVYAKFCHSAASDLLHQAVEQQGGDGRARFSGIDKTVIESLPFFQFSSLRGSKEGLECAVCLAKFEDTEILRLLPKCKHAFHIDCVDRWLESHSSCPLCRHKVDPDDLAIFQYSNSMRFSRDPSDLRENPNVELFVQRETDGGGGLGGSSRFSVGSSFRKVDKGEKDEELLIPQGGEEQPFLHKFNHRIIVSDVVFKNRWSDVNPSDLMFLNSEMLGAVSSRRLSFLDSKSERFTSATATTAAMKTEPKNDGTLNIKEEMERKRLLESKLRRSFSASGGEPSASNDGGNSRYLVPSGKRSMSEFTKVARFPDTGIRSGTGETWGAFNKNGKEERLRKLWLPIARRTVQWLAGRERRSQPPSTRQDMNV